MFKISSHPTGKEYWIVNINEDGSYIHNVPPSIWSIMLDILKYIIYYLFN